MKRSKKSTPDTPVSSPSLVASEVAGPYDFGKAAFDSGDYAKAAIWYRRAAEQGHAEAENAGAIIHH